MIVVDRKAYVVRLVPEAAGLMMIELAARVTTGTLDKMTDESYEAFIPKLIARGHESPLEHYSITLGVLTSRDVMAEMTRHRAGMSFSVESQRHVKATDTGGVIMCWPGTIGDLEAYELFKSSLVSIADTYDVMLDRRISKEMARAILPNCTATNILVTANCRAWRHFFNLRTAKDAYPAMRDTARLMLQCIRKELPRTYALMFREYAEREGWSEQIELAAVGSGNSDAIRKDDYQEDVTRGEIDSVESGAGDGGDGGDTGCG